MSPPWKVLGPALIAVLLIVVGVARLWSEDSGTEAGAALLGSGLTLLGVAVWASLKE